MPQWSGLRAPADHDARPEDDDRQAPLAVQLHQGLLREGLRAGVVIPPVDVRVQGRLLGDRPGLGAGVVRVDGPGVDQPADLRGQACLRDAAGGLDLMLGPFFPGLDVRPGQVVDASDSLERRGEPGASGQVPHDDVHPRILQVGGQPAGVADQHPDRMPRVEELPGQLLADESGGAQDQDLGAAPDPGRPGRAPLALVQSPLAPGAGRPPRCRRSAGRSPHRSAPRPDPARERAGYRVRRPDCA